MMSMERFKGAGSASAGVGSDSSTNGNSDGGAKRGLAAIKEKLTGKGKGKGGESKEDSLEGDDSLKSFREAFEEDGPGSRLGRMAELDGKERRRLMARGPRMEPVSPTAPMMKRERQPCGPTRKVETAEPLASRNRLGDPPPAPCAHPVMCRCVALSRTG